MDLQKYVTSEDASDTLNEENDESDTSDEIDNTNRYYSYDKSKYDAFMLGLLSNGDFKKTQIYLTLDPAFLNKLNKLIENENEIRAFLKSMDATYPTKTKLEGFAFNGFKIGLWMAYPNCKFYFKDQNNKWAKAKKEGKMLEDIIIDNYSINSTELKELITSIYTFHFINLNRVFQIRKEKLNKILENEGAINGQTTKTTTTLTQDEINKYESTWKKLLRERMDLLSNGFTIIDEDTYNKFFTQVWTPIKKNYRFKSKK